MTEGIQRVRCPKCSGNTYFDKDCYGWYEKCLFCGWSQDLPDAELKENDEQSGGDHYKPIEKDQTVSKPLGHSQGRPRRN